MSRQCTDLDRDRKKGRQAEMEFIELCTEKGHAAHGFQIGRDESALIKVEDKNLISPDVSVWSNGGVNTLHEIKRKYPTKGGCIGLEEYRYNSLARLANSSSVWYTVLLHGDTEKAEQNIKRASSGLPVEYEPGMWLTSKIESLGQPANTFTGSSWRNGQKSEEEIFLWRVERFSIVNNT